MHNKKINQSVETNTKWHNDRISRQGYSNSSYNYTSHLGGLVLPQGHWCWQAPFWSLPSSLLLPGAYLPSSWPALVPGPPEPKRQPHWDLPTYPTPTVGWPQLQDLAPPPAGSSQPGQGSALPTCAPAITSSATREGAHRGHPLSI